MKIMLKKTSYHENNLIDVIKEEGLYQNKPSTLTSFPPVTVKWTIRAKKIGANPE